MNCLVFLMQMYLYIQGMNKKYVSWNNKNRS